MYTIYELSLEEENKCFDKYEQTHNINDLEPVFKGLYFILKRYINGRNISYYSSEDLLQECYIAAIERVKTFDRSLGFRFTSYCGNDLFINHVCANIKRFCARKKRCPTKEHLSVYYDEDGVESFYCDSIEDPNSNVENIVETEELLDNLSLTADVLGSDIKECLTQFLIGKETKELPYNTSRRQYMMNTLKDTFIRKFKR